MTKRIRIERTVTISEKNRVIQAECSVRKCGDCPLGDTHVANPCWDGQMGMRLPEKLIERNFEIMIGKEEKKSMKNMKNMVIIKHINSPTHYLYEVPEGECLEAGDEVLVKNHNGETTGICCCDSFKANEDKIGLLFAGKPTAKVVGKYKLRRFDEERK